jgi:hypothetical protein
VTFVNANFTSLGLTPGAYVYTLGRSTDTLTVQIGNAVPEPATWAMMLVGFGLMVSGKTPPHFQEFASW